MPPIAFTAKLYRSGNWVCLALPKRASAALGKRGRVAVSGAINGFAIRTSVFPTGDGGHFMLVNNAMQKGAGAGAGDSVKVALGEDTKPRAVEAPADFRKALAKNRKARDAFEKMPPSHKREYLGWIYEAKRPGTRARRIAQAVERLERGK